MSPRHLHNSVTEGDAEKPASWSYHDLSEPLTKGGNVILNG
jgi:hypothetical protein